jgi:ornithine cyclodeaminase
MSNAIEIVDIDRLRPHMDMPKIIIAVREALIQQAEGKVQSPLPGQLLFDEPRGDCHIKYGHVAGAARFAIKIATGFYDNPKLGLPVNHGLILIMNAKTGAPEVILKDDGWLTAWRTAAATALAAQALAPKNISAIGVIGTGLQAGLAAKWVCHLLGPHPIRVLGRTLKKSVTFAANLSANDASAVATSKDLFAQCNLVITATPSDTALFEANIVNPGTHLVAIGADSPGKQELPTALFARAKHILADDLAQSLDHGDFGTAVRSGSVAAEKAILLGHVLSGRTVIQRGVDDVTIADLTGIAAEDIAIANYFSEALMSQRT